MGEGTSTDEVATGEVTVSFERRFDAVSRNDWLLLQILTGVDWMPLCLHVLDEQGWN